MNELMKVLLLLSTISSSVALRCVHGNVTEECAQDEVCHFMEPEPSASNAENANNRSYACVHADSCELGSVNGACYSTTAQYEGAEKEVLVCCCTDNLVESSCPSDKVLPDVKKPASTTSPTTTTTTTISPEATRWMLPGVEDPVDHHRAGGINGRTDAPKTAVITDDAKLISTLALAVACASLFLTLVFASLAYHAVFKKKGQSSTTEVSVKPEVKPEVKTETSINMARENAARPRILGTSTTPPRTQMTPASMITDESVVVEPPTLQDAVGYVFRLPPFDAYSQTERRGTD